MKKKAPQIIIVLLIIANVFMLNNYRNVINESFKLKNNLENSSKLLVDFKKKTTNEFFIAKESENFNLKPELKLINIEGDTISARSIFKKNSIVLRYSVLNCGECVDAEFEVLKKNAKILSKEIIIITYYERIRGLINVYHKLRKMGLTNVKIYLLPDDKLGIPIDRYNIPSYFHIDSNLKMTNFFIPDKGNAKLSESYLKLCIRNFFDK